MLNARSIDFQDVPWTALDAFGDRTVFQSRPWLSFLAETQAGTPVVAEIRDGRDVVGYFTGMTVRRFGVRILGSSFPGWTTPYMGFNLAPGVPRRDALAAVEQLAFGDLKCLHLEVSDRAFRVEDGVSLGFEHRFYDSYETDLRRTEAEVFGAMNSACRRCIRKAEKSGVTITVADDLAFADEYYEQLKDVFAKQQLVPTYGVDRVRALVRHLLPTGQLLIARAMSADGRCLGTGIYPAQNRVAEFWGNASFRFAQSLRPNEALHWFAMRYWKARGIEAFDWGGGGTYKEKYGPAPIAVPWFFKSRYKLLTVMRDQAKSMIRLRQELLGRMRARPAAGASAVEEDD